MYTLIDLPYIYLKIGPNSSGKSVYIKQIGIIVYLTHIGMYIPCTKAIIGICDSIYTRISSTESVLSQHSSFSLDLNQVSKAVDSIYIIYVWHSVVYIAYVYDIVLVVQLTSGRISIL